MQGAQKESAKSLRQKDRADTHIRGRVFCFWLLRNGEAFFIPTVKTEIKEREIYGMVGKNQ